MIAETKNSETRDDTPAILLTLNIITVQFCLKKPPEPSRRREPDKNLIFYRRNRPASRSDCISFN